MPGRDEYLLSDHRAVVERLVAAEVALEQCRGQRRMVLSALVMVRSFLASDVDEREGTTEADVVGALIDPVLSLFEVADVMPNHPSRHQRG